MAFPSGPTKCEKADFLPMSDQDFARLSTEEKFRHIHLGMLELTQTLVELAGVSKAARAHGEE